MQKIADKMCPAKIEIHDKFLCTWALLAALATRLAPKFRHVCSKPQGVWQFQVSYKILLHPHYANFPVEPL